MIACAELVRHVRASHRLKPDCSGPAPAAVVHRSGDRTLFVATVLPIVLLLVGSFALKTADLDVRISRSFYDQVERWFPDRDVQPWAVLYDFGCYPGLLLGIGGLVVALISTMVPRLKSAGKDGLLLAAVLVVGPGLIVNTVLKPYWGRPRPDETIAFGGSQVVCPFWLPGNDPDGHSFPCGHASMAFYLMAPGFLVWRKRRRLAITYFTLGVSYGSVMGLCWIVQGRHFASDIVLVGGHRLFYVHAVLRALPPSI